MKQSAQAVLSLIKECRQKINQDDLVDSRAEGPLYVVHPQALIKEYIKVADALDIFLANYFSLDQTPSFTSIIPN